MRLNNLNAVPTYDRTVMKHNPNALTFTFGAYPAIEMKHCIEREIQRKNLLHTSIFNKSKMPVKDSILLCFNRLKADKYQFIVDTMEKNAANGNNTEWSVGFQTDELDLKTGKPLFLFLVFSICPKDSAMNGITVGMNSLCIMTMLKDVHKNRIRPEDGSVEETLCLVKENGIYRWRRSLNCEDRA